MVIYTGLVSELSEENLASNTIEKFLRLCVNVSNQYAPCKKEAMWGGSSIRE